MSVPRPSRVAVERPKDYDARYTSTAASMHEKLVWDPKIWVKPKSAPRDPTQPKKLSATQKEAQKIYKQHEVPGHFNGKKPVHNIAWKDAIQLAADVVYERAHPGEKRPHRSEKMPGARALDDGDVAFSQAMTLYAEHAAQMVGCRILRTPPKFKLVPMEMKEATDKHLTRKKERASLLLERVAMVPSAAGKLGRPSKVKEEEEVDLEVEGPPLVRAVKKT